MKVGRSEVAYLVTSLTLVGAGTGPGGTILDGGSRTSTASVVKSVAALVELRDLTVTGGNTDADGGGISNMGAGLTLTRVLVTGNMANGQAGRHQQLQHDHP